MINKEIRFTDNCYIAEDKNGEYYYWQADGIYKKVNSSSSNNSPQSPVNSQIPLDGSILFNCDKTKFLIFVNRNNDNSLIKIYDCSSTKEPLLIFEQDHTRVKMIKWSTYSPDVYAISNKNCITINQLGIKDGKYAIVETSNIISKNNLNISAFSFGQPNNIWMKYTITYSEGSNSSPKSLFLVRPATPKNFVLPFKDYIKMTSTIGTRLDANKASLLNKFIKTKGRNRIICNDESTPNNIQEISARTISSNIVGIHWVNSALNNYLILIDDKSIVYIACIPEVDRFIEDYSSSNDISFLSSTSFSLNVLSTIRLFENEPINFSVSDGLFFCCEKKSKTEKTKLLYRLFLKRRNLNIDNINNINIDENINVNNDENSIHNVVDAENNICKLALLASFDNMLGAAGNTLILNNYQCVKIGEFPNSIERINLSKLSDDEISKYISSFSLDPKGPIGKLYEIEEAHTQKLRFMQGMIENETQIYEQQKNEMGDINKELQIEAEQVEQLHKRFNNVLGKFKKRLEKK